MRSGLLYARMDGERADSPGGLRIGVVKPVDPHLSPCVRDCCALLGSTEFVRWLGSLAAAPLRPTKQPTLFRMQRGDAIDVHDDVSDQAANRLSAVLHLSNNWRREFGGNTVVGSVTRIENCKSPDGYPMRRWVFSKQRSVLSPIFNSMMILALKPGMAHGVTPIRGDVFRLTLVATYAHDEPPMNPASA